MLRSEKHKKTAVICTEEKPKVIRVIATDEILDQLGNGYFTYQCRFEAIPDVGKLLKKSVSPDDVTQGGVGNCYLLSTLSSLLALNPFFLNTIMRINDKDLVEVKLHDVHDLAKEYIYIINPSRIIDTKNSKHKNPLIFLLEKAFAIHRHLRTDRNPAHQCRAVNIWHGKMIEQILKSKPVEKADFERTLDLLRSEAHTLLMNQFLWEFPDIDLNDLVARAKEELSCFLKPNKVSTQAIFEMMHSTAKGHRNKNETAECQKRKQDKVEGEGEQQEKPLTSFSYYHSNQYADETEDLLRCIKATKVVSLEKIKSDYRLTFYCSLDGGNLDEAAHALGKKTKYKSFTQIDDFYYYLNTFMLGVVIFAAMRSSGGDSITAKAMHVLSEMFNGLETEEAKNFVSCINAEVKDCGMQLLREYKNSKEKKSKRAILIDFFTTIPGLTPETIDRLQQHFMLHIPMAKGTGMYSQNQNAFYEYVKQIIADRQIITISTREFVGKKDEDEVCPTNIISKGLLGNHVYQIVSVCERKSSKFICLRNPWSYYGRSYTAQKKIIDGNTVEVLRSTEQSDTVLGEVTRRAMNLFTKSKPQYEGYFELELADLKRFAQYTK